MSVLTMTEHPPNLDWFVNARFGLFVHYGLYSILARGEWAMNRERISCEEMRRLAKQFDPHRFDAKRICDLAIDAGMRYVNLGTMHHDGFRLYDTEFSDFNAKHYCGRDLVEEFVNAARERDLKIALYHSLNNWYDQPDAVDALESKDAYDTFITATHARIKELVMRFNPIDVLWYDGWWPYNAEKWQAERMNAMVRDIQPHILFNGRNGLAGDFGTPEGHMSAPAPWRPWEGCITCNEHWGFHRGDHEWKTPHQIVDLLIKAAANKGNLLFNIGPKGDGSVPSESERILKAIGEWMRRNDECIFNTDLFTSGLMEREGHNGDWSHNGPFTLKGKNLYHPVRYWPGSELVVAGLNTDVKAVVVLGSELELKFTQEGGKVTVTGLPEEAPDPICPVLRFECAETPEMYLGGGMRIPNAPHPPYDPCPSDIQ